MSHRVFLCVVMFGWAESWFDLWSVCTWVKDRNQHPDATVGKEFNTENWQVVDFRCFVRTAVSKCAWHFWVWLKFDVRDKSWVYVLNDWEQKHSWFNWFLVEMKLVLGTWEMVGYMIRAGHTKEDGEKVIVSAVWSFTCVSKDVSMYPLL